MSALLSYSSYFFKTIDIIFSTVDMRFHGIV